MDAGASTPNVVIGLAGALALAVLAAHPAVRRLESRLGVSVLTAAGLPFLALGYLFALPDVGVLPPAIINDLRPAFNIGLGWTGFVVGMQFEARWLASLARGTGSAAITQATATLVVCGALCALALLALGVPLLQPGLVRDVLILAGCAAASAPLSAALLTPLVGAVQARTVEAMTRIDEFVPLALLGLAAALFRPANVATSWTIPPAAWIILALGLGMLCGLITYVLLRTARGDTERIALLLGAVALAAGTASHLALPPAALCFVAGALLANLPLPHREELRSQMLVVERPLFLIFLLIAGAGWQPAAWQGWVLAIVFVTARLIGKRLGALWSTRLLPELPPATVLGRLLAPMSPLAAVVVVSASVVFGESKYPVMQWAINAVIVGGVISEIAVRRRRGGPDSTADLEPRVPGAPAEQA